MSQRLNGYPTSQETYPWERILVRRRDRVGRLRKDVGGREQTIVMLVSEQLREGQRGGGDQHLGKAILELERIRSRLLAARRRRTRANVEKAVSAAV